jgi:hypothetical protein
LRENWGAIQKAKTKAWFATKKHKKNDLLTTKIVGNGEDGILVEVKN